ncbi:DUF2306 domain-containing protein [Dactylosporangium sp. NPDC051485]|uniref:DUF2306 domain-containing protein n=1 Tax=Dactylosporangium sp. NPDC051485 TaxID=3154846 RepID=UPI0034361D8D
MTLSVDGQSGVGDTRSPARPSRRPTEPERPKRAWWMGVLWFLVGSFLLVFVLPVYLTLDPSKAHIKLDPTVPVHYPLLLLHVATGTISMVTGALQMWPWLRVKHPAWHRWSGRVYVYAVFLGAPSLAALVVIRARVAGVEDSQNILGFGLAGIVWLWTTAAGLKTGRERRWVEHRRMMIYSYAIAFSITGSRFFFVIAWGIPGFDSRWINDNAGWFFWVVNLLIAQWWLNRTQKRPLQIARSSRPAAKALEEVP